jgi:hypothetical protein
MRDMETPGTKRLLLGIDVSLLGVILALTTSGSSGAIAVVAGLIGLGSCLTGTTTSARS